MPFFNRRYRAYLWLFRYLQLRDVLALVAAGLATALAVNGYSTRPMWSVVLGLSYFAAVGLNFALAVRARGALDSSQGEVIGALFAFINEEIFKEDYRTRFTLFVPAPGRPDHIIPWYRYRKGGLDPISEARRSKARYRRGEGATGKAWAEAGRQVLLFNFRAFRSEQEFQLCYVDEMNVDPEVVKDLNRAYMMKVQTIFSYGFVGSNPQRTLGVLSLDFQAPVTKTATGYSFPAPDDSQQIDFDSSRMELLLTSVQKVLECLSSTGWMKSHA